MKLRLLVAVTAAALTLTACSSSDSKEPTKPDASKGSSKKLVEVSPLTGLPMPNGRPANPVFVVKIENTANGAPQYGLNNADMVMEELVEGGLTRLAAFYYSNLPTKVGHVRSLRDTDIGIAKPVDGQVVASGGAAGTYRRVEGAGITIFSEDGGAPGFSSDPAKVRPYNRLINLQTVAKKAKASAIRGLLPAVDAREVGDQDARTDRQHRNPDDRAQEGDPRFRTFLQLDVDELEARR